MTYKPGDKVLVECTVIHHEEGDPHGAVSVAMHPSIDVWEVHEGEDYGFELVVPEPLLYTLSDL